MIEEEKKSSKERESEDSAESAHEAEEKETVPAQIQISPLKTVSTSPVPPNSLAGVVKSLVKGLLDAEGKYDKAMLAALLHRVEPLLPVVDIQEPEVVPPPIEQPTSGKKSLLRIKSLRPSGKLYKITPF